MTCLTILLLLLFIVTIIYTNKTINNNYKKIKTMIR